MFDYFNMPHTIEELREGWHVIGRDVPAPNCFQAVSKVSHRPGMYRTAAAVEPERRYFWLSARGQLEPMDHRL